MNSYEELLSWAVHQGVELKGVKPLTIPGRGSGIVATSELKEGDIILKVPKKIFRSLDQVPKTISRKIFPQTSLHALLATYLTLDDSKKFASAHAVFPSLESFVAGVPLMWPSELHTFLPKQAKDLLKNQQLNFNRDWPIVSGAFPNINYDKYMHSWLLVNSRSFYLTTPTMEELPHDDRLALLPIADLFNHADVGCEAVYSEEGYKFIADRAYHIGEEVYTAYGNHSNDFLLAEYGFVLSENRWDAVYLDDAILPKFTKPQKDKLKKKGYLGKYSLDRETGICFRTQVALRLLCCTHKQWQQFADTGNEAATSRDKANTLLLQILNAYMKTIHQTMNDIENLDVGEASQRELLTTRWKQIEIMVAETIKSLDV